MSLPSLTLLHFWLDLLYMYMQLSGANQILLSSTGDAYLCFLNQSLMNSAASASKIKVKSSTKHSIHERKHLQY